MFENLKTKGNKFFNPKNKSPIARFFQNPDYIQDSKNRKFQILFLKLMMIVAYSDEEIEESELNLLKDYAFEHSLSEKEWREIDFYQQIKPSEEEIENIINDILLEIRSTAQKKDLINAIEEMVMSDEILKEQEKEILDTLNKKLKSLHTSIALNWVRGINKSLKKKKQQKNIDTDSLEYASNPAAVVLKRLIDDAGNIGNFKITGAKLGLALIIIYSDSEVKTKEKNQFKSLIAKYCNVADDRVEVISAGLLDIPEIHLEMAYLGRAIVENTTEEERKEFLADLFSMAWSDGIYDPHEDRDLRIISKYLLLSHKDFIAAKLSTKTEKS